MQRKLPDLVRYMPHRDEVRVEYSVGDEVAEAVLTDGSWVFMIFINFASNAFKSTRQGLVSLSAHLVQGRLRLLVADTGIGLSSAVEKQLWQPFRQARYSRDAAEVQPRSSRDMPALATLPAGVALAVRHRPRPLPRAAALN